MKLLRPERYFRALLIPQEAELTWCEGPMVAATLLSPLRLPSPQRHQLSCLICEIV